MAVIHHLASPKSLPKRLKLSVKQPTIATRTRGKSTCIISLPHKLLDKIYTLLLNPRHQIAFALCCRTFASAAAASRTCLYARVISQNGAASIYDKTHLLTDLVRWNFINLSPRPNVRLQLCTSCCKFLPKHRIWYTRDGRPLTSLKKVDWNYAVMLWMHGRGGSGRGLTCPTCQIPHGYDDGMEGQFLQAWDSGFAGGVLREQRYEVCDELNKLSSGAGKKIRFVRVALPLASEGNTGGIGQPNPRIIPSSCADDKSTLARVTQTSSSCGEYPYQSDITILTDLPG